MEQPLFQYNKVIKNSVDFNYNEDQTENPLVICYGIDKNFIYGCAISISSILLNNQSAPLKFHVFSDTYSKRDEVYFDRLAKQYSSNIVLHLVDCEQLKLLPNTKNWSYATYFRFVIADYFSGKHEKILYLDADIACQGSIQELINYEFTNEEAAGVVLERSEEWWTARAQQLDTPSLSEGYFNAGFLLINIPWWEKNKITRRAIKMLSEPSIIRKITHLDQDVLNILLVGNVRIFDRKFNTQYSINYELNHKHHNNINEDTIFIHYIGPTKPWHNWSQYPVSKAFMRAKEHSPWKDTPLLEPENSNQFRYCAKHNFKQGMLLSAVKNYCKYFLSKTFKKANSF